MSSSGAVVMTQTACSVPSTLILGLGTTGLSVARHLKQRGQSFAVLDTRDNPPGLSTLASIAHDAQVRLGEFEGDYLSRAQRLILSPGIAVSEPAIQVAARNGVEILGDIELFAREVNAPVIAVTGSNGKSTVTSLLGDMAARGGRKVRVGANLGTPALDLLDSAADLYVLELSSFQLETTSSLKPECAVVLNVSEDHMDRYASFQDYAAAKKRVYAHARHAVVNRDDVTVFAMTRGDSSFGSDAPSRSQDYGLLEINGKAWLARGEESLIEERELRIKLRHNTMNALAALALAEAAGLERAAMLESLRSFAGLPHRTEWVAERDGITWYNDSKGTNVGATLAAINSAPGRVVLIAGGIGKNQDFSPLRRALKTKGRALVLIGHDARRIAQAVDRALPMEFAADLRDAVRMARALACHGDTVLLSPACASFDMFSGYAERGCVFASLVKEELA